MNQKMPYFGLHDQKHLVCLSRNRMYVNLMNLESGDCVTTFKAGEDRFLNSLLVSGDGRYGPNRIYLQRLSKPPQFFVLLITTFTSSSNLEIFYLLFIDIKKTLTYSKCMHHHASVSFSKWNLE